MKRSVRIPNHRAWPTGRHVAALAASLATTGLAVAQETTRVWTVQPSVSIDETITDNSLLRDSEKRSDAITLLTAGIMVSGRGSRAQASLDYQLTGSVHARETRANRTAQTMRSSLHAELVDDTFFIDASAGISQSVLSAFGLQDVTPGFDNPNRTEVFSLSVTPSLRGHLGSFAVYDARMNINRQQSANGGQGNVNGRTESITLSAPPGGRVGWNASAVQSTNEFENGRRTGNTRAFAGLTYQYDPSLRLSVTGGREENDIKTLNTENNTTWSVGLAWQPSERTQLSAVREHRFFGDAHNISFQHRDARSTWRFNSSRDLQSSQPTGNTVLTSAYDTFFDLFASQQPDPVLRQQLVQRFLQQRGIPANALFANNFLTSAVTLVNRQDLSFGYQGLRDSVAVSFFRSKTRRLDQAIDVKDDFSTQTELRQQALSFTLGHRLTPISGVSLMVTRQRNRGSESQASNATTTAVLNWSTDLGRRSVLSFSFRRAEFDSVSSPYTENAISGVLGIRF